MCDKHDEILLALAKTLDNISKELVSLRDEVRQQKTMFLDGMRACQRAFEQCRAVCNNLSENVDDFASLTGLNNTNF